MISKTLFEIEKLVDGKQGNPSVGNTTINGVSIDTRTIKSGNLFIPIIGEKFNGHEFVETAIENGAVAALWGENEPNPPKDFPIIFVKDTLLALQTLSKRYLDELNVKVVGVTGSNGKTTTKDMISAVLSTTFHVHKTAGNYNNHIGLPLTLLQLDEKVDVAVLEMGMSEFGEIEFLTKLARPEVAVITNIGESHMLDLGSREGIAQAKLEIVEGLQQDGILVYYGDEPLLSERVKDLSISTVTFGNATNNDLYPTTIKQESNGTYFSINKLVDKEFFIPVLGKHNVNNAMAAIAVARHFSVSWEDIDRGLQNIKITNMRLELIKGTNGITMINDAYNASPTSMKAAIDLVHELTGFNKKIVVLGDMLELGEKEVEYHEEIGRLIDPKKIDYVFTFGELGKSIAKTAKEKFPKDRVRAFTDKTELIQELEKVMSTGDLFLAKGSRGMRLEDVVLAFKE